MEKREKNNLQLIEVVKSLKEDIAEYKDIDIEGAYNKTSDKISKTDRKQKIVYWFNRTAAILFIPLLLSTLLLVLNKTGNEEYIILSETKSTPGTISRIELPDQSIVWLNSGTTISYPSVFSKINRSVLLDGEAYFDVKTDPASPFIVSTSSGLEVVARGTSFNVNAYQEDNTVEVALIEGVVDVRYKHEKVTLVPHQLAVFDKEHLALTTIFTSIDEKTAWKEGKLIFRNCLLEDAVKLISRRHNINIALINEPGGEYRIRASFTYENITQIMDYLKMIIPMDVVFHKSEQLEDSTFSGQEIEIWVNE